MTSGSAALLIDVDSFFLAREERWTDERRGGPYDFTEDLDSLARFAHEMARGRRTTVRRAYADFQTVRRRDADERWDFYLRGAARHLMDQGIEPVQLFRFPGGARRSAVDVRLAMDAVSMLGAEPGAGVERFVLVAGDADVIPLLLELRRRGAEVAMIGVSGRTRPVVQRYCDDFESFEDLLAAADVEGAEGELGPVRAALQAVLARRRPLPLAAVKPLLARELGRPFDPAAFDCDTTGRFLERFQRELSVTVRSGEHDGVVDLGDGPVPAGGGARERTPRHTPYEYRWLLRMRNPRVHLVPYEDWLKITELFFDRAGGEGTDERPVVHQTALSEEIVERCVRAGIDAADKKVQATTFQVFKSGAFVCAEPGSTGGADFHWSKPARLAEDLQTVDDLRRRAVFYVARLLAQRMRAEFGTYEIDAEVFTELLEGPDPEEQRIQMVDEVLDAALDDLQRGTPG